MYSTEIRSKKPGGRGGSYRNFDFGLGNYTNHRRVHGANLKTRLFRASYRPLEPKWKTSHGTRRHRIKIPPLDISPRPELRTKLSRPRDPLSTSLPEIASSSNRVHHWSSTRSCSTDRRVVKGGGFSGKCPRKITKLPFWHCIRSRA